MSTRTGIVICFLAAALIVPSVSGASVLSAAGSGGGSAVDQYTEQPPTANGSKPVHTGKQTKAAKPTAQVARALNFVATPNARRTLKNFVTKSDFGASIGKIPTVKTPATGHVNSSLGRSLGALITSPGSGSTGRLAALLAVIVLTTVAVGVSAVRKQRV